MPEVTNAVEKRLSRDRGRVHEKLVPGCHLPAELACPGEDSLRLRDPQRERLLDVEVSAGLQAPHRDRSVKRWRGADVYHVGRRFGERLAQVHESRHIAVAGRRGHHGLVRIDETAQNRGLGINAPHGIGVVAAHGSCPDDQNLQRRRAHVSRLEAWIFTGTPQESPGRGERCHTPLMYVGRARPTIVTRQSR